MVMEDALASMLFSTSSAIAFSGLLCDKAMMVIAFQSSPILSLPRARSRVLAAAVAMAVTCYLKFASASHRASCQIFVIVNGETRTATAGLGIPSDYNRAFRLGLFNVRGQSGLRSASGNSLSSEFPIKL